MAIILGIVTFFTTLFGGLFAVRYKRKLYLVMAFSAGSVLGAALFDLLPEAMELGVKTHTYAVLTIFIAAGFFVYMLLSKLSSIGQRVSLKRGRLGAGAFSIHSFFDGLAIGVGFHASNTIGIVIAIAVLTHDFSDGINTVVVLLRDGAERRETMKWLITDALTPIVGVLSTYLVTFPATSLGLFIAFFAGSFFYIGAGDLLPESMEKGQVKWAIPLTLLGLASMYMAVQLLE